MAVRPLCSAVGARVLCLAVVTGVGVEVDSASAHYSASAHCDSPAGKMSQYLDSLAIGDSIEAKGPIGHVEYLGRGR